MPDFLTTETSGHWTTPTRVASPGRRCPVVTVAVLLIAPQSTRRSGRHVDHEASPAAMRASLQDSVSLPTIAAIWHDTPVVDRSARGRPADARGKVSDTWTSAGDAVAEVRDRDVEADVVAGADRTDRVGRLRDVMSRRGRDRTAVRVVAEGRARGLVRRRAVPVLGMSRSSLASSSRSRCRAVLTGRERSRRRNAARRATGAVMSSRPSRSRDRPVYAGRKRVVQGVTAVAVPAPSFLTSMIR